MEYDRIPSTAVTVILIYWYIVEFAVADIEDIRWSLLPFECLTIPDE